MSIPVASQLRKLPAGFSYVPLHPEIDTPELRKIESDWRARVADYEVFSSPRLAQSLREFGIVPVT